MERPPTYITRCSQKTARKKARKESNISMKKYHHSPTVGVRSDKVSWMPYVRAKKSHELPVSANDMASRREMQTAAMRIALMENWMAESTRRFSDWRSYARRTRGGRRRSGYMER